MEAEAGKGFLLEVDDCLEFDARLTGPRSPLNGSGRCIPHVKIGGSPSPSLCPLHGD